MARKYQKNEFGEYWYDENDLAHSEDDLPAIIENDGSKYWLNHGQFHRLYAPAIITKYGEYWLIRGIEITILVNYWILKNNLPHFSKWDGRIKIMFANEINLWLKISIEKNSYFTSPPAMA